MKKYLFIMLLMSVPVLCSAQLTVDSIGHVSIGSKAPISNAVLNVGSSYYSGYRYAINVKLDGEANYLSNIGLSSQASASTNLYSGRSFGICGFGGRYSDGYNYGVLGGLFGNLNGAGVFGTIYNYTGINVPGKYAGYFDGPTYCNNTITATSFYSF